MLPLPDPAAWNANIAKIITPKKSPTFIAHAGEDQDWFELAQSDRLEIFEKLLPPARRRLLDIGCGPGFFLQDRHRARLARRMASSRRARRPRMRAAWAPR